MDIHVTNLHPDIIESDIQRLFGPYGEVKSINIVRDKLNHRSRGRCFLTMPSEAEAQKAISTLHGSQQKGKTISVVKVDYDPSFSTHLISSKT
jgi:RNA recognition motif-containing protein